MCIRDRLWGGFAIDNPTLNRFYALHYLLPFVIVGVVALHVVALHVHGSNNPLATPPHIVPEWYFLPFYAILRAIPDKLGGVLAMFGSIAVLFVLPWLDTSRVRSATFRPIYKWFMFVLVIDVIVLGWCGANPPEGFFVPLSQVGTLYYFFHFLILLPVLGKIERPLPLPPSIADAVLKKKAG